MNITRLEMVFKILGWIPHSETVLDLKINTSYSNSNMILEILTLKGALYTIDLED